MSDAFILDKNHLPYWLRQLRKERRLIAPMAGAAGDPVYEEVNNIHEIQLEGPALLPSVKEFFIPRTEVMFRFQGGKVQEQVLGVPQSSLDSAPATLPRCTGSTGSWGEIFRTPIMQGNGKTRSSSPSAATGPMPPASA
jgi:hypothetical protein